MERTHHLRVLIASQRADRLDRLAHVVGGLGHDVIAREIDVTEVGGVTARVRPDVALVGLGESSDHALELITESVRGAFCPVIACNAEMLRESELMFSRRRSVLELYDGVVQELAVAHLALELEKPDESRDAMLGALENARAIVGRSLDELHSEGMSVEQLIQDAARTGT